MPAVSTLMALSTLAAKLPGKMKTALTIRKLVVYSRTCSRAVPVPLANRTSPRRSRTCIIGVFRVLFPDPCDLPLTEKRRKLEENADIFCCQSGLIQDDHAPNNFEVATVPAQEVMPSADEDVLILLHTGSITQKIRMNFNF
jgi:hypothetical protein